MNYNYLIVGSGLYGATIAQQAKKAGKSVLVIDKRPNVGGNIYTEKVEGINVHKYGAHISIPITKRYGTMSQALLTSTDSQTLRWPITRESSIPCHSTCTHLIKCGAL